MNIVEVNYNWKKSWANISTAKSERRRKEMEGGERKAGSATFFVSKPEIFHSSGYAKNVNSLNPTSYEPRFVSSFFFFSFFLFFFLLFQWHRASPRDFLLLRPCAGKCAFVVGGRVSNRGENKLAPFVLWGISRDLTSEGTTIR